MRLSQDMPRSKRLPDLVRDTRLDAEIHGRFTIITHRTLNSSTQRRLKVERIKWQREHKVGQGGHGSVHVERRKDKCIEGQPEVRAVKRIQPAKHSEYIHELEAIAKFSHALYEHCFVKFYGWYECNDSLYIAMEYLRLGDLHHYVSEQPALAEDDVRNITVQVLEGVAFMHDNHFAHRDIKPKNILIQEHPPNPWWIKLADFGISKRFADESGTTTTVKGTLDFMAPEVHLSAEDTMEKRPRNPYSADMWAVGCTTYYLFTKRTPFQGNFISLVEYFRGIIPCPSLAVKGYDICDTALDFMAALLQADPPDRPAAATALEHDWLRELSFQCGEHADVKTNGPDDRVEDSLADTLDHDAQTTTTEYRTKDLPESMNSEDLTFAQWTTETSPLDLKSPSDGMIKPGSEAQPNSAIPCKAEVESFEESGDKILSIEARLDGLQPPPPSVENIDDEDYEVAQRTYSRKLDDGRQKLIQSTDHHTSSLRDLAEVEKDKNWALSKIQETPWWWEMPVIFFDNKQNDNAEAEDEHANPSSKRLEHEGNVRDISDTRRQYLKIFGGRLSRPYHVQCPGNIASVSKGDVRVLPSLPMNPKTQKTINTEADRPQETVKARKFQPSCKRNPVVRSAPLRPPSWTPQPFHAKRERVSREGILGLSHFILASDERQWRDAKDRYTDRWVHSRVDNIIDDSRDAGYISSSEEDLSDHEDKTEAPFTPARRQRSLSGLSDPDKWSTCGMYPGLSDLKEPDRWTDPAKSSSPCSRSYNPSRALLAAFDRIESVLKRWVVNYERWVVRYEPSDLGFFCHCQANSKRGPQLDNGPIVIAFEIVVMVNKDWEPTHTMFRELFGDMKPCSELQLTIEEAVYRFRPWKPEFARASAYIY